VIVNGKGRFDTSSRDSYERLRVKFGETIRLRLVNASSTYALRFQIDGHPVTVIATDGTPVQPTEVDFLTIDISERFDVLLAAQGSGEHWIHFATDEPATTDANQGLAILTYHDRDTVPAGDIAFVAGPRTVDAHALVPRQPVSLAGLPFRELKWVLGGTMMPYGWTIDGVACTPWVAPCNPEVLRRGEYVRLVIENPTMMSHPFHMHGHSFFILGVGDDPTALNLENPMLKDTLSVPAKSCDDGAPGYAVVQFKADNPGKWFCHCHIEWHLAVGMGKVFEYEGLDSNG
jgi:FtsP/CotA-like multicopper oxidase with cupredoxin domain